MNSEDVFIFDLGLKLINWRGSQANGFEKFHGSTLCNKIKSERGGKPVIIEVEEGEKLRKLIKFLLIINLRKIYLNLQENQELD